MAKPCIFLATLLTAALLSHPAHALHAIEIVPDDELARIGTGFAPGGPTPASALVNVSGAGAVVGAEDSSIIATQPARVGAVRAAPGIAGDAPASAELTGLIDGTRLPTSARDSAPGGLSTAAAALAVAALVARRRIVAP